MKKLFLLLALLSFVFTACQSGGDVEEDNGGTPFVPEITISPKDLTFGCNGGEQAVDITANFEYEVAERASWLTVEQTDEGLLVVVDANKNTSERSAFISITNSQYDINKSIEVYQEAWVPKIELAQQSVEVEVEPAEYEVAVTSPYSWEATSKNDWIKVITETGIAGTKTLKFSVARNEEKDIREGTIVVKNDDYNLIAELYVTQKTFVPAITIEPEILTFAVEGGTQEVAITANFEYEFSTNANWLTIEKSEKGVNIIATPNTKFEERTTEITISRDKYGISETISVTQKGISAESQNVILYTSYDGNIVRPYERDVFGANIVSNTYRYGQGLIIFDAPVTSIGYSAFCNCSRLTSVTIPNSVTSIGQQAFWGCSRLTSVTIPDSVTEIGSFAFYNCTSLKAFYGKFASADNRCLIIDGVLDSFAPARLTEYTIPDSVTSIGSSAFYNCSSLTSVTIPDSVTKIGNSAFSRCSSLTSVTIPDSVTSIGSSVFEGCSSLTAFYGKFASADNRCLIIDGVLNSFAPAGLTEYTIPDSVTSIGSSAFYYCSSLTSVTIPDSVTSIGGAAFYECSSLTSVTIPDSVTSIGARAFVGCSSLTSVTIGNSVTSIGYEAFYGCSSLTSVYCKSTTPPTASAYYGGVWAAFSGNASGRKIYVPSNSVEAYKSAQYWSGYASDIEGYDF